MALTFGRVPHPGFVDMQWIANNKIEGMGWDNLGKRNPKFLALHRMWGTLRGTDSFFAPATSPHLTDYAIGCEAQDGKALAGEIHKYNDPLGYRSGWASGRVSAPYGDGKAIVDKYGVIAVNRDGVSIEMSGFDTTPIDTFTWGEYVALCAFWCDFMKIPYTSLPINPHTGISAFIWHEEFTIGTGKRCPFTYVKQNTKRLIADVKAYLKQYQEGTGVIVPALVPLPDVPKPQYPAPSPIAALIPFADGDVNAIPAVIADPKNEAISFEFLGDTFAFVKTEKQRRYAEDGSAVLGSDYKVDAEVYVPFKMTIKGGNEWYVTDQWRRIPVESVKRVFDTKRAA